MDSDFHLRKAQALSPKAAKIALRILDADPSIPAEWILALRQTLVQRSNGAPSFRTTDWMTIAAIERPAVRRFTERFESREQRHARLWVTSLRQESGRAQRAAAARTSYGDL
jgi:hypothetical protein